MLSHARGTNVHLTCMWCVSVYVCVRSPKKPEEAPKLAEAKRIPVLTNGGTKKAAEEAPAPAEPAPSATTTTTTPSDA